MASESLWNYHRDEVNDDANENNTSNYMINNKTKTSRYFEYRTQIIGRISNDNNALDTKVVVALKYLSNFWRSLDLILINCEIEPDLLWSRNCIIFKILRAAAAPANPTLMKRKTLFNCLCSYSCDSASLIRNNGNLRSKN